MKYRSWLIVALVSSTLIGVLTTIAGAAPACEPETLKSKYPSLVGKKIKIGVDPQMPPYTYRDPKRFEDVIGFDADLARAVFKCTGVDYEFFPGGWSGLLPAVIAGQIDVMWANLYYTPERAKRIDHVAYMQAGTGALVLKGNPKKIKSMEDVCGQNAAAGLGTVEEAALREQNKKCVAAGKREINIMTYPDIAAGVRLVRSDRAALMLTDLALVDQLAVDNPADFERGFYQLTGFTIGAGVKKGNDDLVNAIYEGLRVVQADGTQEKLFKKYNIDPLLVVPIKISRE